MKFLSSNLFQMAMPFVLLEAVMPFYAVYTYIYVYNVCIIMYLFKKNYCSILLILYIYSNFCNYFSLIVLIIYILQENFSFFHVIFILETNIMIGKCVVRLKFSVKKSNNFFKNKFSKFLKIFNVLNTIY